MRRYLLFLLASWWGWSVQAQKTVDTLSFQQLTKYVPKLITGTHKYVQYYTDSTGDVSRINSMKVRIIKEDPTNSAIVWIIQRYNIAKGIDFDTSFVNKADLKPADYRTQIQSGNYREVVSFTKDSLFTNVYYKDSTKTTSYALQPDYFLATTMEDIMSVLPLKEGYSVIIKTVNPGDHHGTANMKVQVIRKEKIKLSDQSIKEAYLVEAGVPGSNRTSQYWFSVNSQVLLKHVFKLKNGTTFIEERLIL